MTAAELVAELEKNPDYVEKRAAAEVQMQQAIQQYQVAVAPVLEDLKSIGFLGTDVGSIQQLPEIHESAVPILIKWLPRIADDSVKTDIISTLEVIRSPEAAESLLHEFVTLELSEANTSLRWSIGSALERVAQKRHASRIAHLVLEKKYGRARQMLVLALGKLRTNETESALLQVLDDPEVAGHAVKSLGRHKFQRARQRIVPFLESPFAWIRKEAKRALAKIDKEKPTA